MSELSGNKWVKDFTTFLTDLITTSKQISEAKIFYECMKEYGVTSNTVSKYLKIIEDAGIIKSELVEEKRIYHSIKVK